METTYFIINTLSVSAQQYSRALGNSSTARNNIAETETLLEVTDFNINDESDPFNGQTPYTHNEISNVVTTTEWQGE